MITGYKMFLMFAEIQNERFAEKKNVKKKSQIQSRIFDALIFDAKKRDQSYRCNVLL